MLMKNVSPTCLQAAFTIEDPKSAKRQSRHHRLFAFLGSALVKAARNTLVKSTPDTS